VSVRRRLEHLENRLGRCSPPDECGGLALEVREIDRNIKSLETEIAEIEANMTPEELARSRAETEEENAKLDGLSLDEKIAALELEIAWLEAQETKDEERSK
jgi:uncharacterized small protein (DUF1192 family)